MWKFQALLWKFLSELNGLVETPQFPRRVPAQLPPINKVFCITLRLLPSSRCSGTQDPKSHAPPLRGTRCQRGHVSMTVGTSGVRSCSSFGEEIVHIVYLQTVRRCNLEAESGRVGD